MPIAIAAIAAMSPLDIKAEPGARDLIAGLAREPPATVAFTEARFSTLLREPLIVRGELGYLGPNDLERRVTAPYRETTAIRDDAVRVQRDGEIARTFALKRAPELKGFLEAFTALLAGDANTLEANFSVTATGDDERWSLNLTPHDARERRRLRSIEIYGRGNEPGCLVSLDMQGGGSVLLVGTQAAATIAPNSSLEALLARCRTE